MPSGQRVRFSDMPKWFKAFFLFAPLLVLFGISTKLDNDFYFLYPTGEYIINNGFPTTDILSMHSSMSITVQQWLTTVIFYLVYNALGRAGMIALVYICYFIFAFLIYKLCMLITDKNQFVSALSALATDVVIGVVFCFTRPQIFTFIAVALEIYLLEKFVREDKIKYLVFLPLISLFVINAHSAMWLMLFVFAAPYVAQSLIGKTKFFENQDKFSFVKLLVAGAVSFAAGFLNPYGLKAMTYIFSSYGYSEVSGYITEMQPLSINTKIAGIIFSYLVIMVILALNVEKKHYQSRYVLLFAGTLLLGMVTAKSIAYFAIAGIPSFAYLIKDIDVRFNVTESEHTKKEKITRALLAVMLVLAVGVLGFTLVSTYNNTKNAENDYTKANMHYSDLDKICAILEKEDVKKDDIVLYTGFDYGQYMEYKGYHPYIDGRAELFLKDNNNEYDYMKELYKLEHSTLYYKDFLNRYNFNYLVVKSSEEYLDVSLRHDSDYEILYSTKDVTLYKAK